jgi:hypothetical protein
LLEQESAGDHGDEEQRCDGCRAGAEHAIDLWEMEPAGGRGPDGEI